MDSERVRFAVENEADKNVRPPFCAFCALLRLLPSFVFAPSLGVSPVGIFIQAFAKRPSDQFAWSSLKSMFTS